MICWGYTYREKLSTPSVLSNAASVLIDSCHREREIEKANRVLERT